VATPRATVREPRGLPRIPAPASTAGCIRQIPLESWRVDCIQFSDFAVCGHCLASFPRRCPAGSRYHRCAVPPQRRDRLSEKVSKMRSIFAGCLLLLTGLLTGCQCLPGSDAAYSAIDDVSDRLRATPRLDNLYCEDLDPSRCTMHDRGQRMYVRGTHPRHRPR